MKYAVLSVGVLLLSTLPAAAGYSDGGPITLGNFSGEAYSTPRVFVPAENYDEQELPAPAPRTKTRLVEHPKTLEVRAVPDKPRLQTASLEPEEQPAARSKPDIPPVEVPNGMTDAQEQNALAEHATILVAYARRKDEGIKEWTCMSKEGRMMLAHIEARWGKVDITSDGTCSDRNIAGTGVKSEHAFGRAIDMRPAKTTHGTKKEILSWLIAHRHEGWVNAIMTYKNYVHIHVDCGPRHYLALNAWG